MKKDNITENMQAYCCTTWVRPIVVSEDPLVSSLSTVCVVSESSLILYYRVTFAALR